MPSSARSCARSSCGRTPLDAAFGGAARARHAVHRRRHADPAAGVVHRRAGRTGAVPVRAGGGCRGHDRGQPRARRARRRAGARSGRGQPGVDGRPVVRRCAAAAVGPAASAVRCPGGGGRGARRRDRVGVARPPVRRAGPERGGLGSDARCGAWRSAPDHVSAYALTLDDPDAEGLTGPTGDHLPTKAGARRWRTAAIEEQDDDRAATQYGLAVERLGEAGFRGYEISNWARPGHESRHNLAYWTRRPYEAVGPGAHAFDGATRRWNAARLDGYLAALAPADGSGPVAAARWRGVGRPRRRGSARRRSSACASTPACR